jgi:hypothetical protein
MTKEEKQLKKEIEQRRFDRKWEQMMILKKKLND